MEKPYVFESYTDLMPHVEEINVMIFVDDKDKAKKVKTRINIGGHEFQETVTVGEPVSNLIFIQNRSINMLLQVAEEKIRAGEFTEIHGHAVSFSSEEEIDDADVAPAGHRRY